MLEKGDIHRCMNNANFTNKITIQKDYGYVFPFWNNFTFPQAIVYTLINLIRYFWIKFIW